jgi:hypothetical protein
MSLTGARFDLGSAIIGFIAGAVVVLAALVYLERQQNSALGDVAPAQATP